MTRKLPTVENVLDALPAAQAAVKREIAARVTAGEDVAALDLKKPAQVSGRSRGAQQDRAAKRASAA